MRRPPPQLCVGMSNARDRELFPLPIPPAPLVRGTHESWDTGKPCRSVHRRVLRSQHRHSWYQDGVHALNQLSGYPFSSPPECARNYAQSVVLERLQILYDRVLAPPSDLSAAGAFRELCGTSSRYVPSDVGGTAPYVKEYVSWPPKGSAACDVVDSLGEVDREMTLGWEHNILKDAEGIHDYVSSQQRVKPYLEPSLVRRPEVYGDFLSHLDSANMLNWRVGGPSLMGIFFVHKKPGADGNPRFRIILDTRDINGFFRPPPGTRLPSAAAFSSLETGHVDRIYSLAETLHIAFITWPYPTDLRIGSACRTSARGTCQLTRRLGAASGPTTGSSPALGVLPMGWPWSLHLAQKVHEHRLLHAGIPRDSLVFDRQPCPTLDAVSDACTAYVDNFVCISASAARANDALSRIKESLVNNNLPVHEVEAASPEMDFVGLHFDGNTHEVRLSWKRIWRLRLGIGHPSPVVGAPATSSKNWLVTSRGLLFSAAKACQSFLVATSSCGRAAHER